MYHSQRVRRLYEFREWARRAVWLDVAGRREDTRAILIAAQGTFRSLAPNLFAGEDFNEAEAMVGLCHAINCTILQVAGGIRSCPAFIGCYNEDLGTVCYANAGHTPGLLRDDSGITQMEASGLPLGIFSHATHSVHLRPGAGRCFWWFRAESWKRSTNEELAGRHEGQPEDIALTAQICVWPFCRRRRIS